MNRPVDVALVGDARAGLAALAAALGAAARQRAPDPAGRGLRGRGPSVPARPCAFLRGDRRFARPSRPARGRAREHARPTTRSSAWTAATPACGPASRSTVRRPRSLMWTGHYGHLGTGLPYAIGAKLANPNRPVVLLSGDGAFGFNLQELETAARERVAVVAVINCDYAWGMEEVYMEKTAGTTVGVKTSKVRYDLVADALGCHSEYVERHRRPAAARSNVRWAPADLPWCRWSSTTARTSTLPGSTTSPRCITPTTPEPWRRRGTGGGHRWGRWSRPRVLRRAHCRRLRGSAGRHHRNRPDPRRDRRGGVSRALAEELTPTVWINNAGVTGAGALLELDDRGSSASCA